MFIVHSKNGVPVRLTDERWRHIISRHPEMASELEKVLETLGEPDRLQQGDFGVLLAVRLYASTPLTRKFLVVAYREVTKEDGFVLTAYFATKPSARRKMIWKR